MLVLPVVALMLQAPQPAAEYWSQATADYDADRYAAAAHGFERVASLTPQAAGAWAMLGLCEYQLGKREAALSHLERANRLGFRGEGKIRPVALYHLGLLQVEAGRFEDGQKALDEVAATGTESRELRVALGKAVLRTRTESAAAEVAGAAEQLAACNRPEAADAFRDLAARFGGQPNVHYAAGKYLLGQRQTDPAIKEFLAELRVSPRHVLARLAIADTLRTTDAPASLPYAREALRLAPELPLAHYIAGMCLLDNRQPAEAVAQLEAAAKLMPDEPRVQYALARAYNGAGRKADAAAASRNYTHLKEADKPK